MVTLCYLFLFMLLLCFHFMLYVVNVRFPCLVFTLLFHSLIFRLITIIMIINYTHKNNTNVGDDIRLPFAGTCILLVQSRGHIFRTCEVLQ